MKESIKAGYHRHVGPVGPGGLHCPCCNPYGCSVRKMKKRVRRKIRRNEKQQLIKIGE